ncbi:MAG: hypothetical protein Q8N53_13955 [Longimicrobiales bacterium]|nr:hypothetical protein [Longimicrobiales bacterium]
MPRQGLARLIAGLSLVGAALAGAPAPLAPQLVADSAFSPLLGPPAYPMGRGPRVALDEAHHNFHTLDVVPNREPFSSASLSAVRAWVEAGGALLLIADHMPFAGAAGELAATFGFELLNGFASGPGAGGSGPLVFRRSDGSLADHTVTGGAPAGLGVDSVASFTGEAFRIPPGATSLLTLPAGSVSLNPDTAWVFRDETPRTDVSGWSQGALLEVGRGRVAVFGEAAMFSAQLAGPQRTPMGMNAPLAGHNPRLLLNLARWLAGAGEGR